MENKTPETENKTPKIAFRERLFRIGRNAWGMLAHNVWLKLLSLGLAVLLWNYVISTNTSITRAKVVNGLTGYVTGQTTLSANRLALLDDLYRRLTPREAASFTDACSVFTHFGLPVRLVDGDRDNIKITYPSDLELAERIAEGREPV